MECSSSKQQQQNSIVEIKPRFKSSGLSPSKSAINNMLTIWIEPKKSISFFTKTVKPELQWPPSGPKNSGRCWQVVVVQS